MNGWDESADRWVKNMGDRGDWARQHVLDPAMLQRVLAAPVSRALDVGCGEGRFCRILQQRHIETIGIDPTEKLITVARQRDKNGSYLVAGAEKLPFDGESFDLVISYLTLIDIEDFRTSLREMVRVLKPGGRLLISNLNSFISSCPTGAIRDANGKFLHFPVDHYLEERGPWVEFSGLRIKNWHRPLSAYMSELLKLGLVLTYFDEPAPRSGDNETVDRYRRAPWFLVMEWNRRLEEK